MPGKPDEQDFDEMERVEVEEEKEYWNEYKLADGTKLRVKLVLAQVAKSVNKAIPKSGGEPLYSIKADTIVDANVPESQLIEEDK